MLDLKIVGRKTDPIRYDCEPDKLILYALSIGCGTDELDFLFEKNLKAFPTFAAIPSYWPYDALMAKVGLNMPTVLHAEEKMVFHKPIPPSGAIYTSACCQSIFDKGDSGAIINIETETKDASGEVLFSTYIVIIDLSAGNFGGERGPKPQRNEPPQGVAPDFRVEQLTLQTQAALYRLNADKHPLHIDPEYAARSGFERPILHGLGTMGFAARAVVQSACDGDPSRLKSISARFTNAVFPGETLITEGWHIGQGKYVTRTTTQDGRIVLGNGSAEIAS